MPTKKPHQEIPGNEGNAQQSAEAFVPRGYEIKLPTSPTDTFEFKRIRVRKHKDSARFSITPDSGEREGSCTLAIGGSFVFKPATMVNFRVRMMTPNLPEPGATTFEETVGVPTPFAEYHCDITGKTFQLPAGVSPLCIDADQAWYGEAEPTEKHSTAQFVVHPALAMKGEAAIRNAAADRVAQLVEDAFSRLFDASRLAQLIAQPWGLVWPSPFKEVPTETAPGRGHPALRASYTKGELAADCAEPIISDDEDLVDWDAKEREGGED